ncbi:hypothetical protein B0H34DRAFT_798071 [Crassisporium funariophilum]|nr:hypothetical protein B0H34DRAFT_798071 [Crassisporium funariophilum]
MSFEATRSSEKASSPLTVVMIGGGTAGAEVIRGLSPKLDRRKHKLILVTSSPHYVYLPAALRLLADKDAPFDSVFMSYENIFGSFPGELKIGTVTSIEENNDSSSSQGGGGMVVLKGGEQLFYDVLVISTGSVWSGHLAFPNDPEHVKAHIKAWRNKIEDAKDVVIVGGGAVGIEMAGEIKDVFPRKNVTIIQANHLLLGDMYPERFRKDIETRLRRRGVNILFNDTIEGTPDLDAPLKTRNNVPLNCDLLIPARGGRPNTSLLKFVRPSVLTDRGFVKVDPTLQLQSHPNIFALGDIIDWPEAKQVTKISLGHAPVVIANVLSYLNNKVPRKTYTGSTEILAISIGKCGGASYLGFLWGLTFGDRFTRMVKSRDLMVGSMRKSLGLTTECTAD